MEYEVSNSNGEIVISQAGFRVIVREQTETPKEGAAFGLGTLYQEKGGYSAAKVFVFHTLPDMSVEELKKVMDFFFATILGTDLYVKEIPRKSSLFAQESVRLYGEEQDGTVCVIRGSGSE